MMCTGSGGEGFVNLSESVNKQIPGDEYYLEQLNRLKFQSGGTETREIEHNPSSCEPKNVQFCGGCNGMSLRLGPHSRHVKDSAPQVGPA